MTRRTQLGVLGAAAVMALLTVLLWATPALAQVGDTDGADGDELAVPAFLLALVTTAGVSAFLVWRGRRSQPRDE